LNDFPVWAEIDLKAVAHNVAQVKSLLGPQCTLMAVVKADAYGHGMSEVAAAALENGASALGVARLCEAVELRARGVDAPVLVLGYTPPSMCGEIVKNNCDQTVCSYSDALALSRAAQSLQMSVRVHVKIDTGMGRLGIDANGPGSANISEAIDKALAIIRLPGLKVTGIYTHFASSDSSDKSYTRLQFERFMRVIDGVGAGGAPALVRHAANSAAIINMPETHLDMVRAGISLYGLYPSAGVDRGRVDLKPAMSFKSRIVQVKSVPAGYRISYGSTYETSKPTTLGVVSVGYADGYSRLLSSKGQMLVRGRRAPVVGRVCMDLTVLDVSGVDGVSVGDEVVIFGTQDGQAIAVDEIASMLGTINYEVVSSITHRVPRVYIY